MKALGFLFRLVLLVALVVWLAANPGSARIIWHDRIVETSAALLFVAVFFIGYLFLSADRLWRFMRDTPRIWKQRRRIKRLEEGQAEIARGLSAIAGADAAQAGACAVRARKALGEIPSVRLLQAQAAQLAGDTKTARALFTRMSQSDDTAVLGFRGLVSMALREGRYDEAMRLASGLERVKADVPWLEVLRFRLNARLENWPKAEKALENARKRRTIPKNEADRQEAAILLARAKDALRASEGPRALELAEKARRLAPDWSPAVLTLVEAMIVTGHERAALRTIERTWRRAPHPQLAPLAHWALRADKPIEGLRFIEKISRPVKDDPVSLMALAEAALRADLWGQARRALLALVAKGKATHMTYQTLARLERRETGNESAAAAWLARAAGASADPSWLCCVCGQAHDYWQASCSSCDAFNTMEWAVPGRARERAALSLPAAADEWA